MNWKRWAGLVAILLVGFGAYRIWLLSEAALMPSTEEEIASVRAVSAAQDEEAFFRPDNQPLEPQPTNPLNNVYLVIFTSTPTSQVMPIFSVTD